MNPFAASDKTLIVTLLGRAVKKPWVPRNRHTYRAPIDEIQDEGLLGYFYFLGKRLSCLGR